jgi:hypothetical protein
MKLCQGFLNKFWVNKSIILGKLLQFERKSAETLTHAKLQSTQRASKLLILK